MDLTAKWTQTTQPPEPTFHIVTFNAGEGTFPVSGNPTGGNKIITVQVQNGQTVRSSEVPTPTRLGFNFDRWVSIFTEEKEGSTTTEIDFNFNDQIFSNMDLTAKWTTGGTGSNNIITVNQGTGGTISLNPVVAGNYYATGTNVMVIVTPYTGFQMASLSVMNTTTNTQVNYQQNSDGGGVNFTMPSGNVTITVVFSTTGGSTQSYNITPNIETIGGTTGAVGGSLTINPQGRVEANTVVYIYANPIGSYQLTSLRVMHQADNKVIDLDTSSGVFTFMMPDSDVTVFAEFSM